MRAVVQANQGQANAARNRHHAGQNVPRCGRLAGECFNQDGSPLRPCRCPNANAPRADCPYALQNLGDVLELLSSSWAYSIHDERPGRLTGLNASDLTALADVNDNQRKPAPAPT